MRSLRRRTWTASLLLCLPHVWFATPGAAASLQVSPTEVVLSSAGSVESLRLRNLGAAAALIQVEAVAWTDDLATAPRISEIVLVPPVFEIPANGQQVLRIALRQPSETSAEQAYRLLITEVPRRGPDGEGIMFTLRLDLPLFVTPAGARPKPLWSIRKTPDGTTELVLRNEGQAHLRVNKLALQEPNGAVPILTIDQAGTALPGKEHRWLLDQPAHALPPTLLVHAATPGGELVMPLNHLRE